MIKIYMADTAALSDEKIFSGYMEMLDETRKRKVQQCKRIEDKKRSLLAGCLLQAGAGEWITAESGLQTDATPLSLSYTYGRNGKPYLKNHENIYFSLSHSGSYVVCAFSEKEVGIDIQQYAEPQRGGGRKHIADRFFAREDRELLEKLPGTVEENFCRIWAVKEAYMKLTGEGMRQGLDTAFLEPETAIWKSHGEEGSRGRIWRKAQGAEGEKKAKKADAHYIIYDTIERYSIAVCSYGKTADVKMERMAVKER